MSPPKPRPLHGTANRSGGAGREARPPRARRGAEGATHGGGGGGGTEPEPQRGKGPNGAACSAAPRQGPGALQGTAEGVRGGDGGHKMGLGALRSCGWGGGGRLFCGCVLPSHRHGESGGVLVRGGGFPERTPGSQRWLSQLCRVPPAPQCPPRARGCSPHPDSRHNGTGGP